MEKPATDYLHLSCKSGNELIRHECSQRRPVDAIAVLMSPVVAISLRFCYNVGPPKPNENKFLRCRGGTWASATYTYLPPEYEDDDFLGLTVVNPGDLTYWSWNPQHPEYALDYLSPNNLGNVPPTLGLFNDLSAILSLKNKYNYPNNELWQGLVGSLILKRWGGNN